MPCGARITLPARTAGETINLRCPEGHAFRLPVHVLRSCGRDHVLCGYEPRHDVLCGCGWGLLAVPESRIPSECPLCGADVLSGCRRGMTPAAMGEAT